jgi:hypothetical protein
MVGARFTPIDHFYMNDALNSSKMICLKAQAQPAQHNKEVTELVRDVGV